VLERAVDDIGEDLHVAMAVRAEALAARHAVLVDDAQRASAKENVWKLLSQPWSARPRSLARRISMTAMLASVA